MNSKSQKRGNQKDQKPASSKKKKPTRIQVKVMTEAKLIAAAHHMAESRDRFVKELQLVVNAFISFNERLRTYGEFLDKRDELIKARLEYHHDIQDSLTALVDHLATNSIALNETTDRLNEFMTRMDSYFGSGTGLEYDN